LTSIDVNGRFLTNFLPHCMNHCMNRCFRRNSCQLSIRQKLYARWLAPGALLLERSCIVQAWQIRGKSQEEEWGKSQEEEYSNWATTQKGNAVIVGRGAAYDLHDRTDALQVFIYAPFEEKVRRLISKGRAENEAVDLVETVDQERSEYIQKYFNLEWPSRQFFHLMVNSEMGDEMAVETILHAVSKFDKQAVWGAYRESLRGSAPYNEATR
jgi:cytidylate kinase